MSAVCRFCGGSAAIAVGGDTLDRMEIVGADNGTGHVRVFHPSSGYVCVAEHQQEVAMPLEWMVGRRVQIKRGPDTGKTGEVDAALPGGRLSVSIDETARGCTVRRTYPITSIDLQAVDGAA